MARNINPAPLYPQAPFGFMYYFKSGTSTPLTTYADSDFQTANAHPVPLDAIGLLPNVFFEGSAKQRLVDSNLVQKWERDPVGADSTSGQLDVFDLLTIYDLGDLVRGSDGGYYRSEQAPNQGNDPVVPSPLFWSEVVFVDIYNATKDYAVDTIVSESGLLWSSQVTPNVNNLPSTDSGANWLPAVDIANILVATNTLIPQTGGGLLTALVNNDLRDSSTYQIPLANSVLVNQIITISLSDTFKAQSPVCERSGSDTITNAAGTDTSITFAGSAIVELMSDGVSDWRL